MKIDCESLPGHLGSICRGDHVKGSGGRHTLAERCEIVARRLGMSPKDVELPHVHSEPLPFSGYGDRIKDIIAREVGESPCGECRDEISKLNFLSLADVVEHRSELADRIVERAQTKATKWWHRWGATLAPGIAKARVLGWIDEATKEE